MVNRRDVLKVGGWGLAGVITGVGGKAVYDSVTDIEAPEVEAEFTGVEGNIEEWSLNGRIRVQAGDEDAEVTGYIDDRVPIKQETVEAGEEQVYDELSVSGEGISSHEIAAFVRTRSDKYTDSASYKVGLDDFEGENRDNEHGNNRDERDDFDYGDDMCDIHRELNRNQQRSFEGELRTAEEIRGVDLDDIELYSKGDRIYLDDSSTKTGDIQLNGQKRDTDELSLPDRYAERMLEAYEEDRGGFYEGLDDIASGNCK